MKIFHHTAELSLQIDSTCATSISARQAFQSLTSLQSQSLSFINEAALLLFWTEFLTYFRLIPAAGGVVVHEGNTYLWMKRRGVWDLPKGKIDLHETPIQAALREVTEETGLVHLTLQRFITTTWHVYFHKNEWALKPTYWYAMEATDRQGLNPQIEEDIEELRWVSLAEAENLDTFSSIREVWKQAIL